MKKYEVITIGDSTEDIFISSGGLKVKPESGSRSGFSAIFGIGSKIPIEEASYEIGGSACNVAVGLSRLGFQATISTILGKDTPAERILKRLRQEDVDSSNVIYDRGSQTSFSFIFRFQEGRTIFTYHGCKDYSRLHLSKKIFPRWIFLGPTGDGALNVETEALSFVAEKGTSLAWNPGALQIQKGADRFRHLLKNTSVLLLNKEEAIEFIAHPVRPDVKTLLSRLRQFGPKIVVITEGKQGAFAYDGVHHYEVKAIESTECIDATGAGDSFTVGFLSKIMELNNLENPSEAQIIEAMQRGILNSNSVITYIGAQTGLLNSKELSQVRGRFEIPVTVT